VQALRGEVDEAVLAVVPRAVMYLRGEPATMQQAPANEGMVAEVSKFLAQRAAHLQSLGVAAERAHRARLRFRLRQDAAYSIALHRGMGTVARARVSGACWLVVQVDAGHNHWQAGA